MDIIINLLKQTHKIQSKLISIIDSGSIDSVELDSINGLMHQMMDELNEYSGTNTLTSVETEGNTPTVENTNILINSEITESFYSNETNNNRLLDQVEPNEFTICTPNNDGENLSIENDDESTVASQVNPIDEFESTDIITDEVATESQDYISLDELSAIEELPEEAGTIRLDELLSRRTNSDLRKAFTLNDKYRFRRELFGNSDGAMNDSLDMVAAMKSYDEATEYFYTDLGWDCQDENVKEFMSIISAHLSSKF